MHNVRCTMYNVQHSYTMYIILCTTIHLVQRIMYIIQYTCTLYITLTEKCKNLISDITGRLGQH